MYENILIFVIFNTILKRTSIVVRGKYDEIITGSFTAFHCVFYNWKAFSGVILLIITNYTNRLDPSSDLGCLYAK